MIDLLYHLLDTLADWTEETPDIRPFISHDGRSPRGGTFEGELFFWFEKG